MKSSAAPLECHDTIFLLKTSIVERWAYHYNKQAGASNGLINERYESSSSRYRSSVDKGTMAGCAECIAQAVPEQEGIGALVRDEYILHVHRSTWYLVKEFKKAYYQLNRNCAGVSGSGFSTGSLDGQNSEEWNEA